MKVILFAVLLTAFSAPAIADGFVSGNVLLKLCEGNASQKLACEKYLQAVSDTSDFVGEASPSSTLKKNCVPVGTKPEYLRRIFINLLHQPWAHGEISAAKLAIAAYGAVWHCNPKGKLSEVQDTVGDAIR